MNISGRVRLKDSRSISREEFRCASEICAKVRGLVEARRDYIAKNELDPEIALPGNNWDPDADQPFQSRYRHIVEGRYEILNRLRLYAQFSSFDLVSQSIVTGGREVPEVPDDFDEQFELRFPSPDEWIQRHLIITRHIPGDIRVKYPKVLGEIGWEIGGHPVNHDVYAYQERINLMYEAGLIDLLRRRIEREGTVRILEIGGGYGGLAHALIRLFDGAVSYSICDLPESLVSSAIYLGITHPEFEHAIHDGSDKAILSRAQSHRTVSYIPNYLFDDFCGLEGTIDLAINTLSFPEMTERQVRYYAARIKKLLGDDGVLFEQNEDGRWMGMLDCKSILAEALTFRYSISSKTIPVVSKGQADVWSNRSFDSIVDAGLLPLQTAGIRIRLLCWRLGWLIKAPTFALIRLRQSLQKLLSPEGFVFVKKLWNRLGGRMKA